MRFSELISILRGGDSSPEKYQLAGDPELIAGASLDKALSNQISFLESGNLLKNSLITSNAGAVLLPTQEDLYKIADEKDMPWATFKNPRLAFAEVLEVLTPYKRPSSGIHPTAIIGNEVEIGEQVYIGANVFIGDYSKISSGSLIHPGVVIYQEVMIGSESELHSNCVIHPYTQIGDRCVIHSNAVIGSEGFGFIPSKKGWKKMPQTGKVILENDVEIGCNTSVDRPAVGETLIGAGTKIDNLVQIGHGVITGKNCAMASQVGIAGGAKIGNNVIFAGQVGVGNRVNVGDQVIASSKCGIHCDIEANQIVSGFPALPNRLWLKCSATFKKLPEIAKAIKEIKDSKNG